MNDVPLDILIAAYDDPDAAADDFHALKKAQREGLILIEGAILVARDDDGKITVKEAGDGDVFKGATIGVAGGLVLGLFAPPLLGAMVVGGVLGGLIGKLAKSHDENKIKDQVEATLAPGTSGVVAVFDEVWVAAVEKELARAQKKAVKAADKQTAKELKTALEAQKKAEA